MEDLSQLNWFMNNMVGDLERPDYNEKREIQKVERILHRPEKFHNRNCHCNKKHPDYASYCTVSYTHHTLSHTNITKLIRQTKQISACKCNKCIHNHYKTPKDFIMHLLFALNYINYNENFPNNIGTTSKIIKKHLTFFQHTIA
eukprot:275074_1